MIVNPVRDIEKEARRDLLAMGLQILLSVAAATAVYLIYGASNDVLANLLIGAAVAAIASPVTRCVARLITRVAV